MRRRYGFSALLLVAGTFLPQAPVLAQCLPPRLLAQCFTTNTLRADSISKLLPAAEWEPHEGPAPYWTGKAGALGAPAAWVGLRLTNQQAAYDLVYKTTQSACITQLRTELRQRASLRSEPITCVQCWGERLVGYDYTVTIFNQKASYAAKRAEFPYVVVIRRTSRAGTDDTSEAEVLTPQPAGH